MYSKTTGLEAMQPEINRVILSLAYPMVYGREVFRKVRQEFKVKTQIEAFWQEVDELAQSEGVALFEELKPYIGKESIVTPEKTKELEEKFASFFNKPKFKKLKETYLTLQPVHQKQILETAYIKIDGYLKIALDIVSKNFMEYEDVEKLALITQAFHQSKKLVELIKIRIHTNKVNEAETTTLLLGLLVLLLQTYGFVKNIITADALLETMVIIDTHAKLEFKEEINRSVYTVLS
jgi:hypothetical protein